MRKVHYKVVLDVFTNEDDDANGVEILEEAEFWPERDFVANGENIDVLDVIVKSVRVTDSR